MMIHHVPSLIPKLFPQFVWHLDRKERKIFLTFDDGPVPGTTDFVLSELSKREMKATFFMVGENIKKYPDLAKEVCLAGNAIGNHTMHHLNGFKTPLNQYLEDIHNCQSQIQQTLSVSTLLFRPPYGRITKKQFHAIFPSFKVIMWDLLTGDYDPNQSAEACLKKSKKHTKNGSVVVFHDQQRTASIIRKVLPQYLDFIEDQGLKTALL